jgi:hypothetical protein
MKSLTISIAALVSLILPFAIADAAIVVLAPTSVNGGSVSITEDITIAINASGTLRTVVLNNWVTPDSFKTESTVLPLLSISLNGGEKQFYSSYFYDNIADTFNGFTPGDGYFFINNGPNVALGDIITIYAATYTLGSIGNFNPLATQTFTGLVFLAGGSGERFSNNVSIPEPSAFGLISLAVICALNRRSRLESKMQQAAPEQPLPVALFR